MNQNDDLMDQLSRELHDRAGEMDGSMLGLAGVQGRARSIRRRRAATAVVGAAAAVALIVPTAALALHSGGKPEPAPISHSVSPSQAPSQTTDDGQQPATGVLDVSDLPTGAAPAVDYVYDGTLHFRDGGTGEINTRYDPDQLVEMEDGSRVWRTVRNGSSYVELQDADGTFHDPVPSGFDLSVNPKHSIAAWLSPSGQVTVFEGRASQPRPLGDPVPGSDLRLGPVTGDDCSLACTVIVNVHNATGQPWEVSESGSQPLADGGYLEVKDVSHAGLTIGFTRITDFSTCSKLLGGGEFQGFSTCKNQLTTFSPDGRLIWALPGYFDGAGPGGFAMYDLSGQRSSERSSSAKAQATLADSDAVWEDATHVLVPVYQGGDWSLVRIASDGSMEYAVAPRPGVDITENPYVLPTGGNLPS